jgi:hypothetical protein
MTTAHIIHGLKRIAYDHPFCAATCQAAAERLERLEAEHDKLRKAIETKDTVINELEGELATALRGEVQGE